MAKKLNNKNKIFYAALYMRLSREDGDKGESDSIANQRKMLRNYVNSSEDIVVKNEYVDDGFSGTNFERPNFQRMLDDIETGNINCVVVKDLSRFGREYIDTGYYLERYFVDHNIRFIAITDNIDSFEREYDMMMPVKNIFNAQYARDISCKVQSSFKVKQKAGEFIGAFPSYGYQKSPVDRHKLVIDPYAAKVVRRVYQMYIDGYGKMTIAKSLSSDGILCPSAYKQVNGLNYSNCNRLENTIYWTYSTINKMLQNEIYLGHMVQGKSKRRMKGKPRQLEREDWIVVKDTHEAIIDEDTWYKVQNLLKLETKNLDLDQNISIFAGFLKCGDCERALAKKLPWLKQGEERKKGSTEGLRYVCGTYTRYGKYHCSPHQIYHDALEQIIMRDFNICIRSIDNIRNLVQEENKKAPTHRELMESERNRYEAELRRVSKLKKESYEDYKEGLLTKEDFLKYRFEYEEKEKLLTQQIEALKERYNKVGENDVFESPWIKKLLKLRGIQKLDRDIVADMIETIYVYENNKIKIVYNFSDELENVFEKTYQVLEKKSS